MFSKGFIFRRKSSDDNRYERSRSRHSSRSSLSPSNEEGDCRTINPLSQLSTPTNLPIRKYSETDPGPLGLNVIYTPENGHKADIVFVHGLGGGSRWTWSKSRNPELLWPLTFLPLEPDICLARILSFGYNANFKKAGSVGTVVLDFAKELLFDLKYARDEAKRDLKMGRVPLIFVVHSMGGLIVKEAYIQGQNDPEYEEIIRAISAITFLATPHRGTNLAETLNRILQLTIISNSKQYISELARNSFSLQKLNEQFRHIAPRLDIVSFYETQPTPLGLMNAQLMVLEKDSSVLGYPGETSKALNADHHGICKFDSPRDPNYITVRNVLKSLVAKIISTSRSNEQVVLNGRETRDLKAIMAISELPDEDYIFFRDQWTRGTNEWIVREKAFIGWLNAKGPGLHLLWLNGGAATGKSVLSSFVINNLIERDYCCQYFFLRFGNRKKRTLSLLLRSIAYQIGQRIPKFMRKVIEVADEAVDFESADPRTIWQRIFKSILFRMEEQQSLYWVIDGLDEADDSRALIRMLSDIAMSSTPIYILLVSRETSEISTTLKKLPIAVHRATICIETHQEDLRCHIRQELSMSGTAEFRDSIIKRLVEGAENNFLWVRLAVEKLNTCHTHADVEKALQELPVGMEALYDRMATSITRDLTPPDQALASTLLQCVTCSFRTLTVEELSQVLYEDISGMLDFQQSIMELCGGFGVDR
ncbi:hypothetical protein EV356DRAFT_494418 [Viridothelium virens]|uniref:Nephrocystin 3-like N-terminal domain-containing protein n=1 Tax=Viridothelium virens TaxID=1048519 RepID=A0A6A6GTF7_VIRVR|nr:hypothetical protein EV356DRAFT_494418 [Viridothelium virens]